jgi:hypothetical protein
MLLFTAVIFIIPIGAIILLVVACIGYIIATILEDDDQ